MSALQVGDDPRPSEEEKPSLKVLPSMKDPRVRFTSYYRTHAQAVFALALSSLGHVAVAEDVVQETFTRLWKTFPNDPERVRPWLLEVAHNRCLNIIARTRSGQFEEEDGEATVVEHRDSDPAELVARNESTEAVTAAFAGLPPELREVLVLKLHEGWTLAQIAEELGCSEATVKRRFREAADLVLQTVKRLEVTQ